MLMLYWKRKWIESRAKLSRSAERVAAEVSPQTADRSLREVVVVATPFTNS